MIFVHPLSYYYSKFDFLSKIIREVKFQIGLQSNLAGAQLNSSTAQKIELSRFWIYIFFFMKEKMGEKVKRCKIIVEFE